MRAKSEYPIRHGDQHLGDGSDPIPGLGDFIRYHFANLGDYLHIRATGPTPSANVIQIDSEGDIGITAESSIVIDSTNGTGDNIALIGIGVNVDSINGESITLTGDGAGARVLITSNDDDVVIQVGAGSTFTVKDSSGNPKLRWTEGTNDLHIPTGGTIVSDL